MSGIAALFTQARSSKLQIPHPHGICIMGYKGQEFLGEGLLIQKEKKMLFFTRDMTLLDSLTGLHGISQSYVAQNILQVVPQTVCVTFVDLITKYDTFLANLIFFISW